MFLANLADSTGERVYGIAANEYTAVAVGPDGVARVFGDYPQYDDYAYFLQSGCGNNAGPETLLPGQPVDWIRNNRALTVYRIAGTTSASNYFDLNNWRVGGGGDWSYWWADNGFVMEQPGAAPTPCPQVGPDKTINLPQHVELGLSQRIR